MKQMAIKCQRLL